MKKKLSILFLFICVGVIAKGQTALDTYGGVLSTSCVNPNGTKYFGLVTVSNRALFCDPAGHLFFGRGFAPFQIGDNSYTDEAGKTNYAYLTTKYGGNTYTWMDEEIPRAKSWGFNDVGPESSAYTLPYWPWTSGTNPNKWPFIAEVFSSTCSYATMDSFLYSPQPVKNLYYITSPLWIGTGYDGYGSLADYEDPNWQPYVNGDATNGFAPILAASAADRAYLLGVTGCDSDYMHGFGASADFATQPLGKNDFRYSYLVALGSPVGFLAYKSSGYSINSLYPDPTVYAKRAWQSQLEAKYSTISALNSQWGSTYSTFGSSGNCYGSAFAPSALGNWLCSTAHTFAPYSLPNGDGTTTTFSGTLQTPVSPNSVGVFVNGVLAGGDTGNGPWSPSLNATSAPIYGIVADPQVIQPKASGTSAWSYEAVVHLNSTWNVVLPVASTATGPLDLSSTAYNAVCFDGASSSTSCNGPLNGHQQCDLYRVSFPAGSNASTTGKISSGDCASMSDAGQTADGSTAPSPTAGIAPTGSVNYSTGAISVTFLTPPASGVPVAVEYMQNSWQHGTGLMDEYGANTAWVGNNSVCVDPNDPNYVPSACALGGGALRASTGMAIDLDRFDVNIAGAYAASVHSEIQANVPGALDFGPQPWGAWGNPPIKFSMEGMKPYVQLLDNESQSAMLTPAQLDYIHLYAGDIAMSGYFYASANYDSAFAWPGTTCSYAGTASPYTVTCDAALPILNMTTGIPMMTSCVDTSFSNPDFDPSTVNTATGAITYTLSAQPGSSSTTCDLAFWDGATFTTQTARAKNVAGQIGELFSASFSADGFRPYCNFFWWEFMDEETDGGNRTDWGLVDLRDNAYNGVETTALTPAPKCSAPLGAYSCGGELRTGWGTDNGLRLIVNANSLIDAGLAGLGAAAPTPAQLSNGSITNGSIH